MATHFTTPRIVKDKYTIIPFLAAGVFLVLAFSVAYVNLADISGILIIHFDKFKGVDFFGTSGDIFNVIFVGALITLINSLLASMLYFRERFFSYILGFSSAFFAMLIFIGILAIISVN
ncbi:MAG: hypothetical protein PHP03_02450 [Candidatus Pacebacteria bacterium]|nr:hypothetical protein [Candidatus Paceibacterota bacterium]